MHAPRHWRKPVYTRRYLLRWVCSYYHQRKTSWCSCIYTIYAHVYIETLCLTLQSIFLPFPLTERSTTCLFVFTTWSRFYEEDCCWSNFFFSSKDRAREEFWAACFKKLFQLILLFSLVFLAGTASLLPAWGRSMHVLYSGHYFLSPNPRRLFLLCTQKHK